jgi:hypothetical protein
MPDRNKAGGLIRQGKELIILWIMLRRAQYVGYMASDGGVMNWKEFYASICLEGLWKP